MLYDRPYMRDSFSRRQYSPLAWILGTMIAVFVVQNIFERWFRTESFTLLFSLSPYGIKAGYVWGLLTYPFLHSTNNLFHILANGLAIFFLGRALLPTVGTRGFLSIFFGTAFLGGLAWLAVNFGRPAPALIGASAGALGLLAVFACFYPNQRITFLLFFVVPVTVKPKYLVMVLAGIDLLGFLFSELPGTALSNVAHSAHLGGMLGGLIYFRYFQGRQAGSAGPRVEMPSWLRRRPAPGSTPGNFRVNISSRRDLKAEVDRILDKINSSGFGALTPEEKRLLDDAKDLLSRR